MMIKFKKLANIDEKKLFQIAKNILLNPIK